jgi:hypothetical protein
MPEANSAVALANVGFRAAGRACGRASLSGGRRKKPRAQNGSENNALHCSAAARRDDDTVAHLCHGERPSSRSSPQDIGQRGAHLQATRSRSGRFEVDHPTQARQLVGTEAREGAPMAPAGCTATLPGRRRRRTCRAGRDAAGRCDQGFSACAPRRRRRYDSGASARGRRAAAGWRPCSWSRRPERNRAGANGHMPP